MIANLHVPVSYSALCWWVAAKTVNSTTRCVHAFQLRIEVSKYSKQRQTLHWSWVTGEFEDLQGVLALHVTVGKALFWRAKSWKRELRDSRTIAIGSKGAATTSSLLAKNRVSLRIKRQSPISIFAMFCSDINGQELLCMARTTVLLRQAPVLCKKGYVRFCQKPSSSILQLWTTMRITWTATIDTEILIHLVHSN